MVEFIFCDIIDAVNDPSCARLWRSLWLVKSCTMWRNENGCRRRTCRVSIQRYSATVNWTNVNRLSLLILLLLIGGVVANVMTVARQKSLKRRNSKAVLDWTSLNAHLSNDDKMFAGIGRKLRIDVGGKVVEVKIGLLVDLVWVEVVGCVFELTLAWAPSAVAATFSVEPVLVVGVWVPVCGTGSEMFALMIWTSAFVWFIRFWSKLR